MTTKEKNVQPLRTRSEIEDMKWALRYTGTERDEFLFTFGINMGLRVSDILKLRVGDVRGKSHLVIKEQKTSKTKRIAIPAALSDKIESYARMMKNEDPLFPSRNGDGDKPISTTQAYRILQKAAVLLERDDIGTHSMRKTFGYHHYKKFKDVAMLQKLFNHSTPDITLIYIGITDDEIDASMHDFSL